MMKLYMVMYTAAGLVSGYVGPLPPQEEAELPCEDFIKDVKSMIKQTHPELSGLRFTCEWRDSEPVVQEK